MSPPVEPPVLSIVRIPYYRTPARDGKPPGRLFTYKGDWYTVPAILGCQHAGNPACAAPDAGMWYYPARHYIDFLWARLSDRTS
jgi:hypothetical protein